MATAVRSVPAGGRMIENAADVRSTASWFTTSDTTLNPAADGLNQPFFRLLRSSDPHSFQHVGSC
jgi:hypothetical protein